MLLCSSNEDHSKVEPLCPPAGVPLGELVTFEGHLPSPVDPGNRAGKAWKKASKTLAVDDTKVRPCVPVCVCVCARARVCGRGRVRVRVRGRMSVRTRARELVCSVEGLSTTQAG